LLNFTGSPEDPKKGVHLPFLYGCVSTGDDWLFLKLENNSLLIDIRKYYLVELGELLAIFQVIIDSYKKILTTHD
jgi:hypothetical protein